MQVGNKGRSAGRRGPRQEDGDKMRHPPNEDDRAETAPAPAAEARQRLAWDEPTLHRLSLSRSEHTAGAGSDSGGVEMTPS